MESSTNSLLKQLSTFKGNHVIEQCVAVIEDLQKQLEQQTKINQEQKHLIAILQEGKEYYEQQYRNNSYQQQCQQLTAEVTRLTALANTHRKASLELKDTVHQLQEDIVQVHSQLALKDRLIQETQLMVVQLRGQKELLQKQWNKAVKAVKRKIASIVNQKQDHTQSNKQNISIYNRNRNSNKKYVSMEDMKGKSHVEDRKASLIERAHMMVEKLQKEEAIEELENIFNTKSQASARYTYKGPILKENNQQSALFNSQYS